MKSYLLAFLLFFSPLTLPFHAMAQEEHAVEAPSHQTEHFSNPWATDHEESQISIERPDNETDTFQAKFLHMLFILALLIGFMLLASWALKKMMKNRMMQINTGSAIRVIESRNLSPRSTIYLIDVKGQKLNFLIAETPTSVTFLAALPPENPEDEE